MEKLRFYKYLVDDKFNDSKTELSIVAGNKKDSNMLFNEYLKVINETGTFKCSTTFKAEDYKRYGKVVVGDLTNDKIVNEQLRIIKSLEEKRK